MPKYKVEITEYLQRITEVDANDESDAIKKVKSMYDDERIVLSSDDFVFKEINIVKD